VVLIRISTLADLYNLLNEVWAFRYWCLRCHVKSCMKFMSSWFSALSCDMFQTV